MAKVFNPLVTIITFEEALLTQTELQNDFKNYIFDYIKIIEENDTYEKIQDYMTNHEFTLRTEDNQTDVKAAITAIIPKLKKLCDTENMMDHFMFVLHLLEKK